MNKGLLISHLNRAKAKGDTAKIKKYEAELAKSNLNVQDKPNVDNSIKIARKRLSDIVKMKDTYLAFLDYKGNGYNAETIGTLDAIDLTEAKFYQRKRNGFTTEIFFN